MSHKPGRDKRAKDKQAVNAVHNSNSLWAHISAWWWCQNHKLTGYYIRAFRPRRSMGAPIDPMLCVPSAGGTSSGETKLDICHDNGATHDKPMTLEAAIETIHRIAAKIEAM